MDHPPRTPDGGDPLHVLATGSTTSLAGTRLRRSSVSPIRASLAVDPAADPIETGSFLHAPSPSDEMSHDRSVVANSSSAAEKSLKTTSGTDTSGVKRSISQRLSDMIVTPSFPTRFSALPNPGYDDDKVSFVEAAPEETPMDWEEEEEESHGVAPPAEVRASVPEGDDPDLPTNTLRAWFLLIFFLSMAAVFNTTQMVTSGIGFMEGPCIQLFSYFMGRLMERMPYPAHWPGGKWVNPGRFNIKEHGLITTAAFLTLHLPFTLETVLVQHAIYQAPTKAGYQIMLSLSVVALGLAFSGLLISVVVVPSHLIFPQVLPPCALMTALHKTQRGYWNREKVFWIGWITMFLWAFVPHYLFTGLQAFSWLAWIVPRDQTVNIIFGGTNGLGLNFLTMDWWTVQRAWQSPLFVPFYCQVNLFTGYLFFVCFLAPILWAGNVSQTAYFPLKSGSQVYDRWGDQYNMTLASGGSGVNFSTADYSTYSKPYISITQALGTAGLFAAVPATIVHCLLYHRQDWGQIWKKVPYLHRKNHGESAYPEPQLDMHAVMMQRYPRIPWWWYIISGCVGFALAVPTVHSYPTSVPVWLLLVTLCCVLVLILPIGIMSALTSVTIDVHMLFFVIAGYGSRGNPSTPLVANMFGNGVIAVAVGCAAAVKMGHYLKVQARWVFLGQAIGCITYHLVSLGLLNLYFPRTTNLCGGQDRFGPISPVQFTCDSFRVQSLASDGLLWGMIGPERLFSAGQAYAWVNWFWLVGALSPLVVWAVRQRYPMEVVRKVHLPLFFVAVSQFSWVPSSVSYSSWFLVGLVTQYWLRASFFGLWTAINYILSQALNCGTLVALIFISLALDLPNTRPLQDSAFVNANTSVLWTSEQAKSEAKRLWFGNRIEQSTLQGAPGALILKPVPSGGVAPAPNGLWLPRLN